ncbi:DVU_1556 family methyltransferase [Pseudodesulfovibrio sediminis]|uniref:Methyltransferase type 11 domain-containing protein n=1 Tax=Pseudodesulfovibrio sediminis TaxID=2810563 RepID=A0ABM7P598_9BACT|nr:class I SAM-dependent methyltransferase [Pseudodesulfovibrio sediminis]BCS88049.1 hypothetical protein PSDVSF_12910 [Pseudodesulfovibrio sediminis]
MVDTRPLWEQPVLQQAAGDTLRPGGFDITDRGAELAGILPGWRVLDIGCGLGATVARLRSRYGANAYGIDASSEQLQRAEDNTYLFEMRGDSLPFSADSFNAIFAECVLSLMPHKDTALEHWYRVLNPGGFLILSDIFSDGHISANSSPCAQGSIPLADTRTLVEKAGFIVRQVEDHSHRLKELAAKLIFAGHTGESCRCQNGKPGYYLLVAQKGGASHAG